MKMYKIFYQLFMFIAITACKKSGNETIPAGNPFFAKGADLSWITEMESAGMKFHDSNGTEKECTLLMKDLGMNAVRLRVWVNPADGWCNSADLLSKALRAKNLGLKLLLDFHYSDAWADPGQQTKPAAWTTLDFTSLQSSVYDHTVTVMNMLKSNGITPDWVQVGNETNDGMLWPDGKASVNMSGYAKLFKAGYNGVKAVSPDSKVIVHISNGFDNALFRWNLDGLKSNGASWDVIGMSVYPTAANWQTINAQCLSNMNDLANRYGSKLMICEVGMSWDQPDACKAFIADLISKVKSINSNKGLGVFYWEPEAYNNWKGYSLGAFDNTGKPTHALDAFK